MDRQIWQLNRAADTYQASSKIHLSDVQSGRRDDRPQFQQLRSLIESKGVDLVIITRVDRIARDAETNAALSKLFERSGVLIHECLLGRTIDWRNPNDWDYFVRAGVKAEGESRMLSARIRTSVEWRRANGQYVGPAGWPYRKSSDGNIEPDPAEWEKAIALIKIVVRHGGPKAAAIQEANASLGINRTRRWLSLWISSPLIRGHQATNSRPGGRHQPRKTGFARPDILYNAHQSLLADPALAGEREALDRLIAQPNLAPRRSKTVRPLTGLVYCARCGKPCHLRTGAGNRLYWSCGDRDNKGSGCALIKPSPGNPVSTPNDIADEAAMQAIVERGQELIRQEVGSSQPPPIQLPPEALKLQKAIANLEALGDPDLEGAIAKKRAALNGLLANQVAPQNFEEELKLLAAHVDEIDELLDAERRDLFLRYIDRVLVAGREAKAILR